MFKKALSKLIIVSLLLTMIVPNFASAAGGNSLADDFAAKSSAQIVKKNKYDQDLLDVSYYSNNSSFYAVGNNGTMLVSSDGDNWTQVTDAEIDLSANVNFVDLYTTNNQIAVVGTDPVTGRNYIFLKTNNDPFTKLDLTSVAAGSQQVQAVAISGSNIAVVTNTTKYYHSTDNGANWNYDFVDANANSKGATAIAVDPTSGKFKVYNNYETVSATQYSFDSQVGRGNWVQGTLSNPSYRFTNVKNMYRTSTEWTVMLNNGTTSALYRDRTDGASNNKYDADYMLEAAYTEGNVENDAKNILVGWRSTSTGDQMIIRSNQDPNFIRQNSNHKLYQLDAPSYAQTNSVVGNGKLFGIAAGSISGQRVYIAVGSNGSILKSTNGYQFEPMAQEFDSTAQIRHLLANDDPNVSTSGQQVAITDDNRVFYSNDRGLTWKYAPQVSLSGEIASMKYDSLGATQRLFIATNNRATGTATSYQLTLPVVNFTASLSDFTVRGVTTNSNGIVYYGTTPSNGRTKIVSQNNNGGFVSSSSATAGDIQLMIGYGTQATNRFAFNGTTTHLVTLPFGSYAYNIPNANGSGSVNGAINKTYVAWAQGNDRQLLMDASGYVRVFNNPTESSTMYNDTLIYLGQGIPSTSFELSKLVFVNGLYAALGTNGSVYTSFDGIIWTRQSVLSSVDLVDISKSNNTLLLLNKNNTVERVALTSNAWTDNTYVKYPNLDITRPPSFGPYDGTQAGVNVITVNAADDPNAAGATASYKWFKEDVNGVIQEIAGQSANTLDLSVLSAGFTGTSRVNVYVEVTYSDATKVDQPQSKRMYGPFGYDIKIPRYEIDVAYSATSFSVLEGYNSADVTPIEISIENTGDTDIPYLNISSNPNVVASIPSYSLAVGETITGQVLIAANKPLGSYTSDVEIWSPYGSINERQTITYQVTDVPKYVLDAGLDQYQIQLAHNYGSVNDAKVVLTLGNWGNRDIEALAVTLSDSQHFELSSVPAKIEWGDAAQIEITPKVTLQPGRTYTYELTVNSEAGATTLSPVTITVEETPRYDVTLAEVKNNVTISENYTNASSGELMVTIRNTGNRDLNDLSIALLGGDAGSFTLNAVSPSLPVGQSVSVIATPLANLPVNEYTPTLSVTSAATGINSRQALRLVVTDVPVYTVDLSLSTNTLNLPHGYTTNDGIITVTLQNTGNRDVAPVVSVSDSAIIAVGSVPSSIAANSGGSFELAVRENVAGGTYAVAVTVTTEAGTQTETINVTIASAPLYRLNVAADRQYANLGYNYTDAGAGKFVLTALNDGNQNLQNIAIDLSDAVSFTVGSIPTSLAVGADAIVEVTPVAGLAAGSYPVTVTFRADQMTDQALTLTVVVATAPTPGPTPDPTPGSTPAPTSGPGSSPVVTQPIVTTNGQITIPAGASGTTSFHDEVTLHIPANASAQELSITIEQLLDVVGLNQNGEEFASPVYEILNNGGGNLNLPVTVEIQYDPSFVHEGQYAAIFYYDEIEKEWIEIGGEVRGDRMVAETDRFAKFTVLVKDKDTDSVSLFTDVEEHWGADNIAKAVKLGFVSGYPDHTFRPNDAITREQFAVMLTGALSMTSESSFVEFTDGNLIAAWAKPAVASAVEAGLVRGYGDGSFAPKSSIKRSELAVMIARAAGVDLSAAVATSFTDDSSIPQWSKPAIASLQTLGLISGKGNGQFAPQATATRAEAVTIILNLLNYLSK